MSDLTSATPLLGLNRPGTWSFARLTTGLLWLTFALSGIVWIEPAPFDFLCIALIGLWLMRGLSLPDDFRIPVALLGILAITGVGAALFSSEMFASARHITISVFLYVITVGLAAHIARDSESALSTIMSGYTVAAVVAVLAGAAGYFQLSDAFYELFTERARARGTFKDPNVFGPFLIIPAVYGVVNHVTGRCRFGGMQTWIVALLCAGVLLSFSRGAWGNFALSLGIAVYLLFVSSRSNTRRVRIIMLTALALALMLGGGLFALSFDAVADMMSVRGHLIQSYDTQERFHGATIALKVILEHPFGVGSNGFSKFHHAEPHNVYLYSFLIGGWLGGFAYIGLVGLTIFKGIQAALYKSRFQSTAIVFVATFVAAAAEGLIVDTDHWRHFYLLMAGIWGMRCAMMQSESEAEPVDTIPRSRLATIAVRKRDRGQLRRTHLPAATKSSASDPSGETKTPTFTTTVHSAGSGVERRRGAPDRAMFGLRQRDVLSVRSEFGRRPLQHNQKPASTARGPERV